MTRTKEGWTLVWPRRREGWGSGRASRGSRSLCGLLKDGEERASDGAHSLDGHWRASCARHFGNLAQLNGGLGHRRRGGHTTLANKARGPLEGKRGRDPHKHWPLTPGNAAGRRPP